MTTVFSPCNMHAPRATCAACINLNLLKSKSLSKIISESTGPIFTKFSPYGRYLILDYWFDPLFLIAHGKLPWQPILGFTVDKIGRITFISHLGILKWSGILQFRFWQVYLQLSAVWLCGASVRPSGDQYWVFWVDHYSVLFYLYGRGGRHCYAARATR